MAAVTPGTMAGTTFPTANGRRSLELLKAVAGLPAPDAGLRALDPVKSHDQYRERDLTETEEAVWYSAEEPDTLAAPQQVRLRSIHSKQATVITFSNKSKYRVRALWVDFKGNEVAYSILEPNSTKRYHTYVTHPWIVRELHSATRMMLSGRPTVVGLSTEQIVEVQQPPTLDWSLSHHCFFPEPYRSSIRGLLLAHKALEPYAAATRAPAGSHALAARDILQSPKKRSAFSPIRTASTAAGTAAAPWKRMWPMSPCPGMLSHNMPSGAAAVRPPLSPAPAGPGGYAADIAVAPRSKPQQKQQLACQDPYATTTSVSISSEAALFHATLTVSSPRLASMKSTVNIELATPAGVNRTTINFDSVMADVDVVRDQQVHAAVPAPGSIDQLLPRAAAASSSNSIGACQADAGSKKPTRGLLSMLKMCAAPSTASPRNMLRTLLGRPSSIHSSNKPGTAPSSCDVGYPLYINTTVSSPRAQAPSSTALAFNVKLRPVHTSLTVEVQQCDDVAVDDVSSTADACWPPRDSHLGNLPSHLLVYIAELAAPVTWQSLAAAPGGRPDIKPTLMACPPITAEQQQQLEEQEQQLQQQQQQGQLAQ